jgi:hypothetical protein
MGSEFFESTPVHSNCAAFADWFNATSDIEEVLQSVRGIPDMLLDKGAPLTDSPRDFLGRKADAFGKDFSKAGLDMGALFKEFRTHFRDQGSIDEDASAFHLEDGALEGEGALVDWAGDSVQLRLDSLEDFESYHTVKAVVEP